MPAAYRVEHVTRYVYASTVAASQHVAYLRPRELPYQHVRLHRLDVEPAPATATRRTDYFGNAADHFQILTPHVELSVSAFSLVDVMERGVVERDVMERDMIEPDGNVGRPCTGRLLPDATGSPGVADARRMWVARPPAPETAVFAYGSPHAPVLAQSAAFAAPSFDAGQSVLGGAIDLMHRIHEEFTFDPSATSLANPVTHVLDERRGVCQDFAHLHVSALRSIGIPARYVSGYLLTDPPPGQPRLIGADASHAWVAVFCPILGWVDLDPTNGVLAGTRHVTVAWGRDYGDVSPLRGVLIGGTQHTLSVGVSVIPAEEPVSGR